MKTPTKIGVITVAAGLLHFAAAFVIALFLWLGEWGDGPQGGEVSLTPAERHQREQIKPYEQAFMVFLRGADRVLSFPITRNGSRELRTPRRAVLNSCLWGVAVAVVVIGIQGRRKAKAQPTPAGDVLKAAPDRQR